MHSLYSQPNSAPIKPSSDKSWSGQKYQFDISTYGIGDKGREAAEHFIETGFQHAYNASIKVSTPWILAINNGAFKAALGIRSAHERLFLEQYLAAPIETMVNQYIPVRRAGIAEIAHLYSNSNKFTLPLFLITAVALFTNGFAAMTFSATSHVQSLIQRAGIITHELASADPSKLQQRAANWGSYYQTEPKVVAVSLRNVMQVINSSARYRKMFELLTDKIAHTVCALQAGDIA
ncbi:thermostable hemolysin [Alteromonas flava]|uniref:thermostable hemolysin n=1 Tax=Alteromonas flava TaxID=2048003 RepID=UPI000C282B1A|nr:thermostable hemolysin [Alteromonas flava]